MERDYIKNVKKQFIILFLLGLFCITIILSFCSYDKTLMWAYAAVQEGYNDFDFEDNSVIIQMNEKYEDLCKKELTIFNKLPIKSISNLSSALNCNIYKLEFDFKNKEKVIQTVDILKNSEFICEVIPNYLGQFEATANDADFNKQWNLNGTYGINANQAWNISEGSKNIRVGVIDTGVSAHGDLIDNLVQGWNFIDNNSNTEDVFGHGTHVAGIIGAVGDNKIGIAGVNKLVSIVPLKISDTEYWDISLVIQAINYAQNTWGTEDQIKVINFSGGNYPDSASLRAAINSYSGLFVCAAANNGTDTDISPNYPGSYNQNNQITVGSIDSNGNISTFSNYGKKTVDLFAPGGMIYSTLPNNGYGYMSGTSMAAPHVAGVAALLLSKYPNLTTAQLKSAILNSVDKVDSLTDLCVTGGRLNAYKALMSLHNIHNYNNDYVWVNTKQHNATCVCGETKLQGHAVSAGQSTSPTRFKLCLLCGGRADYGFVQIGPDSEEVIFVTDNGSFILPNGIAVLVDNDIQAYIDGTLRFYDKNTVRQ